MTRVELINSFIIAFLEKFHRHNYSSYTLKFNYFIFLDHKMLHDEQNITVYSDLDFHKININGLCDKSPVCHLWWEINDVAYQNH